MDYKYSLTILTPTYNRRELLARLNASLSSQSQKDFQWLVIDDGSTDQTKEYFDSLKYSGYEIEYHRKENGGKHTALNYAHPYIKGEFVCIVDSDDYLVPEAVFAMHSAIQEYKENKRIACISFLKGANTERALVKGFPEAPTVANHINFRINGNRFGDCCEVVRTSTFTSIPFPVFQGERFMSEGYLWVNIALNYNTVYIRKILYICEYIEGGLTQTGRKLRIECPLGGMVNSNTYLLAKNEPKLNWKTTIKEMWLYICYGKFAGFKYPNLKNKSNRPKLFKLNYLFGMLLYIYWKHKYT